MRLPKYLFTGKHLLLRVVLLGIAAFLSGCGLLPLSVEQIGELFGSCISQGAAPGVYRVSCRAPDGNTSEGQVTVGPSGVLEVCGCESFQGPPTLIGPAIDLSIDLSASITDSPDPLNLGDDLIYTITITNNSSSTATGVNVLDELLPGAAADFVTASTGCNQPSVPNTLSCNLGTLAARASATVTIVVRTRATGTITNRVTVSSDFDFDSSNDTATATTTVIQPGGADLAVTVTDDSDPVGQNGAVTYTVTVTNNGPATATGVMLTNVLPPVEIDDSLIMVSQGSFNLSTPLQTIMVNFGTLAPGASATLTATGFTVPTGTFANTATVTANEPDPNPANNTASESTTVIPP